MPIRLIAIDIDGTLLDSRWQLPAANRDAILAAVARGIEVALVTGRRFDFAMPIANQIPCPLTMIVNNGALIKSKDGATHLRNLLPRATAHRVLLDTLPWRAGAAVVFDRQRENQVVWEFMDWDDPGRRSYFERNREYLAQVAPLESCLTEDPIQVMFTGPVVPMRELAAHLPQLPYAAEFALALTEYEDRNFSLVDVVQPGCSKGAALAAWTGRQGFSRDDVMAIGDNLNDREMLEFAGTPVVMANAVPALKSNGWHLTASHDSAGVAAAIQRFVFSSAP
jgi:hypothetical protein